MVVYHCPAMALPTVNNVSKIPTIANTTNFFFIASSSLS